MDKTILFTLLHDAWGEGSNESLRLSMMRLTDDALAEGDAKALADMVPEIPIEKWQAWRTYYSPVRYDLRAELLDQLGVQIMLYADDAYPEALRAVYRPPSILYIKGHFELAERPRLMAKTWLIPSPRPFQMKMCASSVVLQRALTSIRTKAPSKDQAVPLPYWDVVLIKSTRVKMQVCTMPY